MLVVLCLVWLVPAVLVGRYAHRHGEGFGSFFLLSLFVSWVLGFWLARREVLDAAGRAAQ